MNTQELNKVLEDFQRREEVRRKKSDQEQAKLMQIFKLEEKRYYAEIMPNIRHATQTDYEKWLRGYLESGKLPTHSYDYIFPDRWYVATRGFNMIPMCGASAIQIIVPKKIRVTSFQGIGHCNIYFMDGFRHEGFWVPIYEGMRFKENR